MRHTCRTPESFLSVTCVPNRFLFHRFKAPDTSFGECTLNTQCSATVLPGYALTAEIDLVPSTADTPEVNNEEIYT